LSSSKCLFYSTAQVSRPLVYFKGGARESCVIHIPLVKEVKVQNAAKMNMALTCPPF
jgi:hypothetical protein